MKYIDRLSGVSSNGTEVTKVGEALQGLTNQIAQAGNAVRVSTTIAAQAKRELAMLGVAPDANGHVDIHQLNGALRASGLSPEKRIQIKCLLASVGAIQ